MRTARWSITAIGIVFGLALTPVQAFQPTLEFSAQAIQQMPNQKARIARMHVAKQGVRMEYQRNDQPVVEIYNFSQGRAWLLMTQQKVYMEQQMSAEMAKAFRVQIPPANPCEGGKEVQCRRLGEEKLDGRQVVKWEMTAQQEGRTLRSLHWLDRERNLPLRQLWPDGSVSELKIAGTERLNGRATEKWELLTTRPDGELMRSTQWFDPELQIAVREELPGGFLRELRELRVGTQPIHLFQVPEGYRQVSAPVTPQSGQAPNNGSVRSPGQYPGRY